MLEKGWMSEAPPTCKITFIDFPACDSIAPDGRAAMRPENVLVYPYSSSISEQTQSKHIYLSVTATATATATAAAAAAALPSLFYIHSCLKPQSASDVLLLIQEFPISIIVLSCTPAKLRYLNQLEFDKTASL